ncbi:MAG: FUSC family protein [Bacteroidota bacterium]|nr:FUSC family protein [Bacteroidota bacterium]
MDYIKEYKSFISSYYLAEGVRKTVGILLPALVFGYFNALQIGIVIAIGALCVSITDNPGPILHRMNGFVVCAFLVFLFSIITGFAHTIPWLWLILLPLFCFFFSLITVYGARSAAIGVAVLLVIVLETQYQYTGWKVLSNAAYLLAGGVWYILLSLLLYKMRPYKLAQQALGDYVLSIADYLRVKAALYDNDVDYEKMKQQLVSTQIAIQEKQNLVTELIFKTRSIVQESTHIGRVLVMAFLDVTDLFEITMASHQDYEKLHEHFEQTAILTEYGELIRSLAKELDAIGWALQSGKKSVFDETITIQLVKERERLEALRKTILSPGNVEMFISLKHILDTMDDISRRIQTLHHYTTYDRKLRRKKVQMPDPEDFISHQAIDLKLLWDNLSFQSNIFRHSLRIAMAAAAGYLIARLFIVGHSYWILLTVVVILKPGYSLTKERNIQRISGTVSGVILTALLLWFIKDNTVILVTLAICMIIAFSFIRRHYFVGVFMITVYVLLMFHLIGTGNFSTIMKDRLMDTLIGSVLAWLFNYLIPPIWEQNNIKALMEHMLQSSIAYYKIVADTFTGKNFVKAAVRVERKNSLVALANLSDTFNRMLSEPKSKQEHIEQIHQFVVSVHMLTSHIATLTHYAHSVEEEFIVEDYKPLITLTQAHLHEARNLLKQGEQEGKASIAETDANIKMLDERIGRLLQQRKTELEEGKIESSTRKKLSQFKSIADQFYFIYKITVDINKIADKIKVVA